MTARFVSETLDLSRLPAPEAVQGVSYESIFAARLARFKELWPDFDMDALETDPAVILQQVGAYRETLGYAALNDAVRSLLLPYATGANLDNLAAFYGVQRHVLVPADPPDPAVMEPDEDLRRRVQLAPEALPYAGMTGGGYRSLALLTAPSVKDVAAVKRGQGRVDVVLLAREGDGTVEESVVNAVYNAFKDDAATQLTDIVSVRAADVVTYDVTLTLRLPRGPDPALVRQAAERSVRAYVDSRHRVGLPVYRQMIEAAASVGGVERAILTAPAQDVVPDSFSAAYCDDITITHEVIE